MYENCKIYGPYKRKDGRKHVIVVFPNKQKITVSYPKFLIENKFKRYLKPNETVDHIDGNFENNNYNNLRILDRSKHTSEDVKRYKIKKFICPECKKQFSLSGHKLSDAIHNRRKGKSGPFCSRNCAGKYGAKIQNGKTKKLKITLIIPEFTSIKSFRASIKKFIGCRSLKRGSLNK